MTTENLLPPENPIDISILLPTRGRPKPLEQCLRTLLDRAQDPSRIEVMLAFDNDDIENIILGYLEKDSNEYKLMTK